MKRLLFITWDGPQVNYLEGLFLPILVGLKERYQIHVVQFTWGQAEEVKRIASLCHSAGIKHNVYQVERRPLVSVGTMWTMFRGSSFLKGYINDNDIDIVMPRSTFPAWMVTRSWPQSSSRKLIWDMDGFPMEERADFSGLDRKGAFYRRLKRLEDAAMHLADIVLLRTEAAKGVLASEGYPVDKCRVVVNGRDSNFFMPTDSTARKSMRASMGLGDSDILLLYLGSLGPQYCFDEMLALFSQLKDKNPSARFLILTGSLDFIQGRQIEPSLKECIIIKNVPFKDVPEYLGAADAGLAIRMPSISMLGVAPIKLGEYLLCGLPVIATKDIGDTAALLEGEKSVLLLSDHSDRSLKMASEWLSQIAFQQSYRENARSAGLSKFSLKIAIESYLAALEHL